MRSPIPFVAWSLATMFGYLFAAVGSHFPGSFPVGGGLVATFDSDAAIFGLVIGSVGGLVIGISQWLVLRSWLGIGWPWLVATAVAVGLTHALGDGLPSSIEWPPVAIAGGILMSTGQWVALRGRDDRGMLALGYGAIFALALIVGITIADPHSADWRTAHIVAAALTGAFISVIYGAALFWTSRVAPQTAPRSVTG